ncbi:LOW QUALITY PROTEIN: hypothetical protein TorRG33x02_098500 [Trema orientale]|uniref:Uncharacterized protein n=1 Tax=Trema orientale TaxID=63057 RepID=A0A2P5F9D2_TREOI|nr:LOW QUALITY PROTEIN: hypothetical protein TorRG33x02_098500 [Trema orientale]
MPSLSIFMAAKLKIQNGAVQKRKKVTIWTYMLPNPSLSMFHPKTQKPQKRRHVIETSLLESNNPPFHSGACSTTFCSSLDANENILSDEIRLEFLDRAMPLVSF